MSASPSAPSLGFPQLPARPPADAAPKPTPLPKRPKGRWFVGLILLSFCAAAGYQVWQAYFRYQAYGVVTGRTVHVGPPWEGVVQYLYVRPGDKVRQGQLLVTLDNLTIRQSLARVEDDLAVAQANFEAEAAKLKMQSAYTLDQGHGAVANYYEALATLQQERAKLEDLNNSARRLKQLGSRGVMARNDIEQLELTRSGQEQKVASLTKALTELKRRADQADHLLRQGGKLEKGLVASASDQLKPALARIQALLAEKSRLRDSLNQGEVRSPTNGTVIRTQRLAGERCQPTDTLVNLLEDDSLEVVLYLPQEASTRFAPGDQLRVTMEPYSRRLTCTVLRLGDELEPAPESIKRHYREGQRLLPAYLQPEAADVDWMALRVHAVVALPADLWPANWFHLGVQ